MKSIGESLQLSVDEQNQIQNQLKHPHVCGDNQKKQHFRGSSVWPANDMLCRKMETLDLILSMAKGKKMKRKKRKYGPFLRNLNSSLCKITLIRFKGQLFGSSRKQNNNINVTCEIFSLAG